VPVILDRTNVDALTAAALLTAPREAYEISTAIDRVAEG
jgi:hypothetical protein